MSDSLFDLWRSALEVMIAVSAPLLVTALVVGIVIAIVQAATQLQDSVLAFVPKLAAAVVVIALSGHWAIDKLSHFTREAFTLAASTPPSEPSQTRP
ncbi:MAG TPA: flagellar biosynthetic protein FliQ [Kofleriaceae bacterium]|nr:flagellar biosynthetic protein FliQ [Kofleriaceae bacterium]